MKKTINYTFAIIGAALVIGCGVLYLTGGKTMPPNACLYTYCAACVFSTIFIITKK